MAKYLSRNRPMVLTTPLGPDALLVAGVKGHEGLSELFHFRLDLRISKETAPPFERLLGQKATLTHHLPEGGERHVSGILNRFVQHDQDEFFTWCQADLVPRFWLWTRRLQSRIFQQQNVPEILRGVLDGLDVNYQLTRTYPPREYCVQYRETDFAFASRLMEEEGIYYFFQHGADNHQLVVTDGALIHPDLAAPNPALYDRAAASKNEPRVHAWSKEQTIAPGKYLLWDHHFELPDQRLEGLAIPLESIRIGTVSHALKGGHNADLEVFDGCAGQATRFDAIGRDGSERADQLPKVHDEVKWTARIRVEEETARGFEIRGSGDYGHFVPGHVFQLGRHFDADGKYLLTRVEHEATQSGLRSGDKVEFSYRNSFTCLPADLPYRPRRRVPRPVIAGTQTALVVGPAGKDSYLDKFGRVKVQFYWDRHGNKDAGSSCWLRVAQLWAGKRWGAFFWPRVGHEVVVSFEEGDPDRPIVVGSVYNAKNMPPFELPDNDLVAGIKSCSAGAKADPLVNYNGLLFIDRHGEEHVEVHSERDQVVNSESSMAVRMGQSYSKVVGGLTLAGSGSGGGELTLANSSSGSGSGGGSRTSQGFDKIFAAGWGADLEFTFGQKANTVLGLETNSAVGNFARVVLNPLGLAGLPGGGSMGGTMLAQGLTGMLGSVHMIVGANTNLSYGPKVNINRGRQIEHTGELGVASAAAASVVAGLVIAANAAGALFPDKAPEVIWGALSEATKWTAMGVLVSIESGLAWSQAAIDWGNEAKFLATLVSEVPTLALIPHVKTTLADAGRYGIRAIDPTKPDPVHDRVIKSGMHLHLSADRDIHICNAKGPDASGGILLCAKQLLSAQCESGGHIQLQKDWIYALHSKRIWLRTAYGEVDLDAASLTLKWGVPGVPSPAKIFFDKDGITLSAGISQIKVGFKDITLSAGPTTLMTLNAEGIEMKALQVKTTAELAATTAATIYQEEMDISAIEASLKKID